MKMNEKERASCRAHFQKRCLEHRLRVTPQRTAIYEELLLAGNHPSADLIYRRVRQKMPNISFDTVYRALLTFAETGISDIVAGFGGKRRFDADQRHHHHFYCLRCRAVFDFLSPEFDQALKTPSADLNGRFRVSGVRVIAEGTCPDCAGAA